MTSKKNFNPFKDQGQIICRCNGVPQKKIEEAMNRGCNTLTKIFDSTRAGVGACGGSCQPILRKMLNHYKKTGKFLEKPRSEVNKNKRRKKLKKTFLNDKQ